MWGRASEIEGYVHVALLVATILNPGTANVFLKSLETEQRLQSRFCLTRSRFSVRGVQGNPLPHVKGR